MSVIENNLYPPVVATFPKAFIRKSCKLYFSLSSYNTKSEISNVQITVRYQNSNQSALDDNLYPAGIMFANMQSGDEAGQYYVEINSSDIKGGFQLNQYYKVQLRFTGTSAAAPADRKKIAGWLVANQQYFSEWSTVCLIRPISQPEVTIRGLEQNTDTVISNELIDIIGNLSFDDKDDEETMYSYSVNIYEYESGKRVYPIKDETIYTSEFQDPNEINYKINYMLQNGVAYKVVVDYMTRSGYVPPVDERPTFMFSVIQHSIDKLDATITAEPDFENGRIKVEILPTATAFTLTNITIRRAASTDNFTRWYDIHTTVINHETANGYVWYDYTAESGVWYKYCVQKRDAKGHRGEIVIVREPTMVMYDDMFLVDSEMQLRVRYDPTVSNFRTVVSESKIDTIGSRYPHFRRNGDIFYRQFPISGLITAFCDDEGLFINRKNTLGEDNLYYYDRYNDENRINEYNDVVYEREFREKVMAFLYKFGTKLYKSTPEGNILVRLMDVSFTPVPALGRMLYHFNATAYEVDECSIENYDKYDIQPIGEFDPEANYSYPKLGQLQGKFAAREDLFQNIYDKYQKSSDTGILDATQNLGYLQLEFESEPYLIKMQGGVPVPAQGISPGEDSSQFAYGYIVYVNNQPIVVSPRGTYELTDAGTEISSVYFPVDTQVSMNYIANILQTQDPRAVADKIFYYTKVGQLSGNWNVKESIYRKIYLKYREAYKKSYQRLMALAMVDIETIPGAVVWIQDSLDDVHYKHEVGSTGVLKLYDEDRSIMDLYFAGVQLYPAKGSVVRENEFKLGADPTKPARNEVFTIGGKRMIYYSGSWYEFSNDNIVQCPVEATVDYICEVAKGVFN